MRFILYRKIIVNCIQILLTTVADGLLLAAFTSSTSGKAGKSKTLTCLQAKTTGDVATTDQY